MQKKLLNSVKIFYPRYSQREVIDRIKKSIPELKKLIEIKRVILFGSYAKGNFTAKSDIDILIIYSEYKNENLFKEIKKTINLYNLQPHLFTEKEYKKQKEIIDRMIKDGIQIYP